MERFQKVLSDNTTEVSEVKGRDNMGSNVDSLN